MLADIGPDAVPEQLDSAFGAIRLEDAGAAELEEGAVAMARDQPVEREFAR
jgi:hypothetical protein